MGKSFWHWKSFIPDFLLLHLAKMAFHQGCGPLPQGRGRFGTYRETSGDLNVFLNYILQLTVTFYITSCTSTLICT